MKKNIKGAIKTKMKGHSYKKICKKCGKNHRHPKGTLGKHIWKDKKHPNLGKENKWGHHIEKTKKLISDKAKERLKDKTKHPMYGKERLDVRKRNLENNPMKNLKTKEKMKRTLKKKCETGEIIPALKYLWKNPEFRKSQSERMKYNNPSKIKKNIEKIRRTLKEKYKTGKIISPFKYLWKNLEFRKSQIKRMKRGGALKARKANKLKPNKPEKIIINLIKQHNLNFIYVGNSKKWFKGKTQSFNPDFINEEKKKIIELFGDYWHANTKEIDKERINTYRKYGYKTLILWQYELKNSNQIINKINKFICRDE